MITWHKCCVELVGSGWREHKKKNKTKGIFPGPWSCCFFLVLSSPKKSSPLVGLLITTIRTFSQGLEAKTEKQKASDGEASPAVAAGAFGAWREVRKGDMFSLEKS